MTDEEARMRSGEWWKGLKFQVLGFKFGSLRGVVADLVDAWTVPRG